VAVGWWAGEHMSNRRSMSAPFAVRMSVLVESGSLKRMPRAGGLRGSAWRRSRLSAAEVVLPATSETMRSPRLTPSHWATGPRESWGRRFRASRASRPRQVSEPSPLEEEGAAVVQRSRTRHRSAPRRPPCHHVEHHHAVVPVAAVLGSIVDLARPPRGADDAPALLDGHRGGDLR